MGSAQAITVVRHDGLPESGPEARRPPGMCTFRNCMLLSVHIVFIFMASELALVAQRIRLYLVEGVVETKKRVNDAPLNTLSPLSVSYRGEMS